MMYKKILLSFSILLCWACSQIASGPEMEDNRYQKNSLPKSSSSISKSSTSKSDVSSSSKALRSSSSDGFDWSLPKTAYLNPDIEYSEMTDKRDGKKYKTVKIGEQTWMAENLNYADSNLTPSIKGKNWCIDNDEAKCEITGRFYTWAAAIDSIALANDKDNPRTCGHGVTCDLSNDTIRGICPEGWHVPSYREWMDLHDAVGGEDIAGKKLKSKKGWPGIHTGTDDYGFSAIPTGFPLIDENAKGKGQGERTFIFSTEEWGGENNNYIHNEAFVIEDDDGSLASNAKWGASSVRCIKDT